MRAAQHKRRALNVSNSVESLCDDHGICSPKKPCSASIEFKCFHMHTMHMPMVKQSAHANGDVGFQWFPFQRLFKTSIGLMESSICNILFTRQLAQSNNSMTMKVPSEKCCCVSFLAMEARSVRLLCVTSRWCEMKNHAAIAVHGARDLDGFGYMIFDTGCISMQLGKASHFERMANAFSPMRSPIFFASALSSSEMSSQQALGVSSLQ